MSRWVPRSLFGQMLLILLAGLLVSHVLGTLIFVADRARAVRAIGAYAATQRIANLAQLIDEAPADWRARIAAGASDATLRVALSPRPPDFAAAGDGSDSRLRCGAIWPRNCRRRWRTSWRSPCPPRDRGWAGFRLRLASFAVLRPACQWTAR